MMTDPIADMLTRIRNASQVRKKEVVLPYSKIKKVMAEILVREGYLAKTELIQEKHPAIVLTLKYDNGLPAIRHLKRVSRPGARQYIKKDLVGKILDGFGLAILSTPKGILTDSEARKAQVGGELLCEIY